MLNSLHLGVAALATLGAASLVTANASGTDLSCGVYTSTTGGMQTIEGRLISPDAVSGEYRFALKSSSGGGSSNISQGGQFAATANTITLLGRSMLNADARVEIDFTVLANGKTIDCSQPFASRT